MASSSPLIWQDGLPRSAAFGDVYYSLDDGLAETQAVFLAGCGLPERWQGRARFTIAELGFGTGLNIAAALTLWDQTRAPGQQLHIFSLEGFPLAEQDAAAALGAWPQIGKATEIMLARWPSARRGMHRIELPEFAAVLDLRIGEVAPALAGWSGRADAWFLDGFAPSLNPDMWRDEILALVGARSAPGARAATFTVAGHVRRGLAAAGFEVAKRPGHGRKRERLEAVFPGEGVDPPTPRIAILGGGIAGASLARAFRALGARATVIADHDAGASGNPAALVMPALDAGGGVRARLYAEAFARAVALYDEAAIAVGALQLETTPRDAARFDVIAGQNLFRPDTVRRLDALAAATLLGEASSPAALVFDDARVVAPGKVLCDWLGEPRRARATALRRSGNGWLIELGDGGVEADAVVLAAGWTDLSPALSRLVSPVRGQASWVSADAAPYPAAAGSYAIPTGSGVLFGATHDRGGTDTDVRDEDHARNLAALAALRPALAAGIDPKRVGGRAAIRVATPDRMPLAGRLEDGLYVLSGLGSRGFTTAPLLAEHVAALVLSAPTPLSADLAAAVDPARFETKD